MASERIHQHGPKIIEGDLVQKIDDSDQLAEDLEVEDLEIE